MTPELADTIWRAGRVVLLVQCSGCQRRLGEVRQDRSSPPLIGMDLQSDHQGEVVGGIPLHASEQQHVVFVLADREPMKRNWCVCGNTWETFPYADVEQAIAKKWKVIRL